MRNVDHAVAALGALTGLPDLAFNGDGHLELVVDDAVSIDVVRIDERHLELSAAVKALGHALDLAKLGALLAANGALAAGSARFALDPRDRAILICERLDVVPLDERGLEERLVAFVGLAKAWNADGAERLLAGLDRVAVTQPPDR